MLWKRQNGRLVRVESEVGFGMGDKTKERVGKKPKKSKKSKRLEGEKVDEVKREVRVDELTSQTTQTISRSSTLTSQTLTVDEREVSELLWMLFQQLELDCNCELCRGTNGLSDEMVLKIPTQKDEKCKWGQTDCIICMGALRCEGNKRLSVLPCEHVIHEECLRPWLKVSKKCPCCSVEILIN